MYENRDNSGKERESKEKNKRNKDRKKDTHTKTYAPWQIPKQVLIKMKKGECIVYL